MSIVLVLRTVLVLGEPCTETYSSNIWVELGVGYKYDGGGDYWITPAEAASDQ
jgi:hypothetical protein